MGKRTGSDQGLGKALFLKQPGKAQPDLSSFPSLKVGISRNDDSVGQALAGQPEGPSSAPQHRVKSQAPRSIRSPGSKEAESGFLDGQSGHKGSRVSE